jgi:oxepin-CoA hydrolase/3-oxo-5,6-dehydrosuberyl-CoA semialdehyde dehydrogenase
MGFSRLTAKNLPRFQQRIGGLTADNPRKWGTMNAAGMLRHLRAVIEMSLEEVPVKDTSTFYSRTIMRVVAFHVLPTWPKGKIKAPSDFTPKADSFEDERKRFLAALERFVEAESSTPNRVTLHPLFGRHPLTYWAHIHGRHFEHHFEQFGI